MKPMTYKKAKSFNRKLSKHFGRGEISCDNYLESKIDIFDLIINVLTTDQDLPVKFKVIFHCLNENGLRQQLPKFDDFVKDGYLFNAYLLYSRYENFHAKRLVELSGKKKISKWDADYHIKELTNSIAKYKEWKKEVYDKWERKEVE